MTTPSILDTAANETTAQQADRLAREVDAELGGGPSDKDPVPLPVMPIKRVRTKKVTPQVQETTVPAADAPANTQEAPVAKTKKTSKKSIKKTVVKKAAPAKDKGPGVIATIARMMERGNGASKSEIHAELVKLFPGRNKDALATTTSIQVNRYPTEHKRKVTKEKSDKRGLVYYMSKGK